MRTKIIVIVAVIIILVIIGVVLMVVLLGEGGGNGGGGNNGYKFPDGATFEDKLRICLEQNLEVQECHSIYDESEASLLICESLGELRDKCIYKVAVENNDLKLCERINTAEIGIKCSEELKGRMIPEQ